MQILSKMSEDNVQYKLTNKISKEEIKLDDMYYEPDTNASQIKIAILKYYGVDGVDPSVIKLRSKGYKNNTQDIGPNVELSTILTDANSDNNEITFEMNQSFQNAADTLVAKHKINKPQRFTIKGVEFDYVGDIKDRMPNGKGQIRYYTNNDGETTVYEGEVKNGLADGYGKIIFSKDQHPRIESYQGLFSEGHIVGMRVDSLDNDDIPAHVIYRNGDQYEGGVTAYLQARGMGKMIKPNGDVYVGEFNFGVYNGDGKMTYADGTVFDGRWINGNKVTNIVKPKWDENRIFGKNFQVTSFDSQSNSPPNSPERKKNTQSSVPPLIVRKKKRDDDGENGGGLFTRKYNNQKKGKTRRYAKRRRSTNKNKKPKRGNKSKKHK
jgi:hypothetical protein